MNPDLKKLHPYPFEKLSVLMAGTVPDKTLPHIAWSIGEPKHEPPAFALKTIGEEIQKFRQYPSTKGIVELRQAISDWATAASYTHLRAHETGSKLVCSTLYENKKKTAKNQ